jgi:hypothetical protein
MPAADRTAAGSVLSAATRAPASFLDSGDARRNPRITATRPRHGHAEHAAAPARLAGEPRISGDHRRYERVLSRLVRLERAVGVVEAPTVPKHTRARPLGG